MSGKETDSEEKHTKDERHEDDFTVVAIGASAGGLEALEAFFSALPDQPGVAFIVVVHLDAKRKSLLPELLQRTTTLTVSQASDQVIVAPDHVYVIPPGVEIKLVQGVLELTPKSSGHQSGLTVDVCFRSLADDKGSRAVAVVLSGTGTDGTLGIRAIKGETGMVMAQDESAKYEGMPKSAIDTGLVDYVLPPENMPAALLRYTKQSSRLHSSEPYPGVSNRKKHIQKILSLIRARTGHDFSEYKTTTLSRRIERRMSIHHIDELGRYITLLQTTEIEADTLFRELLIGVTSFFRDPHVYERLKSEHLKALLTAKSANQHVRVWVPACSTGEEAYSIAMTIHECLEELELNLSVQVFGTDIDARAIDVARVGRYPESIKADVGQGRFDRYFDPEEDGTYRISKMIRAMLVFAPQSLIKDPPFSKLDLISCRNLLIYFSAELQSRLLSLFHYSLLNGGLLVLGASETIGRATELFHVVDRKCKIFGRRLEAEPKQSVLPFRSLPVEPQDGHESEAPVMNQDRLNTLLLLKAVLKESDALPFAVIDKAMNIVFVHGSTGRYLEPPEGEPSNNILDMARPGLRGALATNARTVLRSRLESRQYGVVFRSNGDEITVDLVVKPLHEPKSVSELLVVFFQQRSSETETMTEQAPDDDEPRGQVVAELRKRLSETRENLQTTIEELETSNEELKSMNEELQSTNEELQSTNEELETSKEELQSLNEESGTVNVELQSRLDELVRANDDLKNLLVSTGIATIFLDTDLCVRRYTPGATELIPLTSSDTGRPLSHLSTSLLDVDIEALVNAMLDDLVVREKEVETSDGRYFLLKIRPYRTVNNAIDGAIITFEERTEIKKAQRLMTTKFDETNRRLEASQLAHEEASRELAEQKKQ